MTKTWLRVSAILYLVFGVVSSAQAGAEGISKSVSPPSVFEKGLLEKVLANAPDPGPSGLTIEMPEKAADCRCAYGGIYLVFKFPEMKKLGIFNIAQGTFEKYFPISTKDINYACGGNTMVVYDASQKQFHLYNMATLTQTATKKSSLQGNLTDIEMGIMESDKAAVSWTALTDGRYKRYYGLMEIPEMPVTELRIDDTFYGDRFPIDDPRDNVHIRLDPQMRRFLAWEDSGYRFLCGIFDGTMLWSSYDSDRFGSLSFLPDRSRIVSSRGDILDTESQTRHKFFTDHENLLFAVDGANMVIKISGKEATLVDAINLTELQTFTLPFELKMPSKYKGDLTIDRRVYASSYLKRAVFIDNAGQKIFIFKLKGEDGIAALADQLTGVKAGTTWTRKLDYPEGTKLVVEDAPEGVRFNPATMTLSWQIPLTQEPGSHLILVSVVEPEKEEVYQRISITIR